MNGIEKEYIIKLSNLCSILEIMEELMISLTHRYSGKTICRFEEKYKAFIQLYKEIELEYKNIQEKLKNPCYGSKYFYDCTSNEMLQKKYKQFCKELHPDNHNVNNSDAFVEMKAEYEKISKAFNS